MSKKKGEIPEGSEEELQLRIYATGIRTGEFITSSSNAKDSQVKGTIIQIRGEYPPSLRAIALMNVITVRDKLNAFSFFQPMNPEERLEWLKDNAVDNRDLYMDDCNLELRFVKLSGRYIKQNLTEETINMLLKGNPDDEEGYWPIKYVYNLFPRKPGSRARKHTLIFRPNNWELMPSKASATKYKGIYFDLDNFTYNEGKINKKEILEVINVDKPLNDITSFAISFSDKRKEVLTWDILISLVDEQYVKEINKIKKIIDWFPPALHKSLLQKIIRTRCKRVSHNGKEYNSISVLLSCLMTLMLHSGSFVPNINRWSSGMESIFKRLAVTIQEDSYYSDGKKIAMLYACAMLAQQNKSWQPTNKLISIAFEMAISALESKYLYEYDWHNFNETNIKDEWGFSYLCLYKLGSFKSDINMLGSIAENEGKNRGKFKIPDLIEVMPLTWCVDQHTYPEIAHYFPYDVLVDICGVNSNYSELFNTIWNKASGINPRNKKYFDMDLKNNTTMLIRKAQEELWLNKTVEKEDKIVIPKKIDFNYILPEAWLAGLIGVIEVKIKTTNIIVVLRSDDIFSFTIARAPSREEKEEDLTDEEKKKAKEKAISILENGIELKNIPIALKELKGSSIRLEDEERYILTIKGSDVDWLDFIDMKFTFNLNSNEEINIKEAIIYNGNGISRNADLLLDEIISTLSNKVLLRLMSYLENNRSIIELYKIARKGNGQELAVTIEDSAVFEFLCKVCCLYPACLSLEGANFIVKNGPLLWSIRDKIKKMKKNSISTWDIETTEDRELREYQKDIVKKLKERHNNKEHGSLVLAPTGSGKSLCITTYIHWLIKKNFMYKYCVWILPSSATKAIKRQLKLAGLPVNIIDMRKGSNDNILIKKSVNIIWHDHIRLNGMDEQLKKHATDMLFIVDEFHKTINNTIRTSITLEMIKLSAEFIGISGTIIINEDYKGIIPWLESIVPYEVNQYNYLVAAASLISKKVVLPIYVSRKEIEAKMINPEQYYQVVTETLGGTAKMLNLKKALEYCYESCLIEIVELVKKYKQCLILAKDSKQQILLKSMLEDVGIKKIILINKDNIVNLTNETKNVNVAITTKNYVEGYDAVLFNVAISPVILSNQATREQFEGRILRSNQTSDRVTYITVHCGILTYIMNKYEKSRQMSKLIRSLADDIGINVKEIRKSLA